MKPGVGLERSGRETEGFDAGAFRLAKRAKFFFLRALLETPVFEKLTTQDEGVTQITWLIIEVSRGALKSRPSMPLKFFHISSRDSAPMEAELNSFLSRHRVVTVERRFVEAGADSFWALCVDFLHGEPSVGATHGAPGRGERKVDYKDVLTPEQFEVFSKLRELRKQIADKEAVPVYAIFTNEQLAIMVQKQADSRAKLREIEGIGEAKVEKYAEPFLALLNAVMGKPA